MIARSKQLGTAIIKHSKSKHYDIHKFRYIIKRHIRRKSDTTHICYTNVALFIINIKKLKFKLKT